MTTCLHCDANLGKNLLLPEYPVGKQLAFDPEEARLWTVCPECERWNLSWLDESERQTAVARLDQYFAATPHKAAIQGIGVAEVEKTKLIRIGDVPWPTFAGWRYARRLQNRFFWGMTISIAFIVAFAFLYTPLGSQFRYTWVADTIQWMFFAWSGFPAGRGIPSRRGRPQAGAVRPCTVWAPASAGAGPWPFYGMVAGDRC